MADASVPRGSGDPGWGPATSVRSASADAPPAPRAAHTNGHNAEWDSAFYPQPTPARPSARERLEAAVPTTRERGLPGWAGLLVLVGATTLGILFDAIRGHQLALGFNVGIIAGSVIAILVVRRSGMFPVVVAPPIVYSLGAGISLYLRSSGLHDRGVLIDAATNWLVYGFPAIAAATASVLIIAGIRLIVRR
ncbi:MAG TPA: DUF6542 domain-containing protein [Jatrophihabitantaceae bacterium]|nr:DUF6542 domain-containing protein [Jatrophihabitantaceae bacterium]